MKISEVIERLEEFKITAGDVDVLMESPCQDEYERYPIRLEEVAFEVSAISRNKNGCPIQYEENNTEFAVVIW